MLPLAISTPVSKSQKLLEKNHKPESQHPNKLRTLNISMWPSALSFVAGQLLCWLHSMTMKSKSPHSQKTTPSALCLHIKGRSISPYCIVRITARGDLARLSHPLLPHPPAPLPPWSATQSPGGRSAFPLLPALPNLHSHGLSIPSHPVNSCSFFVLTNNLSTPSLFPYDGSDPEGALPPLSSSWWLICIVPCAFSPLTPQLPRASASTILIKHSLHGS